MGEQISARAIPEEVAAQLCRQIQERNRGRWLSYEAWWCWGCRTFTGGDPAKMCFHSPPDYRGCAQVNRRFDRGQAALTGKEQSGL